MIISTTGGGHAGAHGLQLPVRSFSGARAARVVGAGNSIVEEHSHDWPVLSLYVMGDYWKAFDRGDIRIDGPSAVLHGAGEAHANRLGASGLEQIDIQFDPRWLRPSGSAPAEGVHVWIGGPVSTAAGRLAMLWADSSRSEAELAIATRRFLEFALVPRAETQPRWLSRVRESLRTGRPQSALELGRQCDLHPSWLAQAYRSAVGEGLRQTVQRRRVEQAAVLLRTSSLPLAEIAATAGFCDQSHMNRAFRALLDRTPGQVRAEASRLT